MRKDFNWNANQKESEAVSDEKENRVWHQIHLPEITEKEEHLSVEEAEEMGLAYVDEISPAQQESMVANAQEGPAADTGHGVIGGLDGDGSGGGLDAGGEGGMGMDGGAE